MAFQIPNRTFAAGGNVSPSVFVKITNDDTVSQCTTGDDVIGVSQAFTKLFNDPLAAETGNPVGVYGESQECFIPYGGSITAGQRLGPTTGGLAIAVSSSVNSGAIALESGASGELHRVRIQIENITGS